MDVVTAIDRELARIDAILSKSGLFGAVCYNLLQQRAYLQSQLVELAKINIKTKE
jgi:hypothetical protein